MNINWDAVLSCGHKINGTCTLQVWSDPKSESYKKPGDEYICPVDGKVKVVKTGAVST